MNFIIEKNIPIPETGTNKLKYAYQQFPFKKMKPGDSFLIPAAKNAEKKEIEKIRARVSAHSGLFRKYEKKTGWKFTTKVLNEGIRIWRVK